MPPGPPNAPQILPRQPGETAYAYRNRRSVALTGESLYERRIRQGRARGLSTQEARGQRAGEAQRRRTRQIQQTGQTPWEFWRDNQLIWLVDNDFTPETTGWSWNRLIRVAPRLRFLNDRASAGGQITPDMIAEAVSFERTYALPSDWSYERLNERYIDTVEYLEYNNKVPGNFHWFHDREPNLPAAWWYYH
jgi:hypothetical protein